MNYETLAKLLFLLPTETSHHLSLQGISVLGDFNLSSLISPDLVHDPVTVMGIEFPNRVGLAAGLDKDAKSIDGLGKLGFGFLEVGTVTPKPQAGNPKPRLFRLEKERAIINRMGFNNEGLEQMTRRIKRSSFDGILGINIGKNATTPAENSLDGYVSCLRKVYKLASYIVVNISSPNTKGLRDLQHGDELAKLLAGIKAEHELLKQKYEYHVPLVVKIAPDMDDKALVDTALTLLNFELDGVIVSNTTISRDGIAGSKHAGEGGGLSGAPLKDLSDHALSVVANELKGKMAIIGVGGIMDGAAAAQKIRLGADLVQLYSGFIYSGPRLVRDSALAIKALGHNEK